MTVILGDGKNCPICGDKVNPVVEDVQIYGNEENIGIVVLVCSDCSKKLSKGLDKTYLAG